MKADRVSIYGMYDMHLFHKIDGATVDEVIANWVSHNSEAQPAIVAGRKVDDMGPSSLCPVLVLSGDAELRYVGEMVHIKFNTREHFNAALESWRKAVADDHDIARLLAEEKELV